MLNFEGRTMRVIAIYFAFSVRKHVDEFWNFDLDFDSFTH